MNGIEDTKTTLIGGAGIESVSGIAAIVLAILGLAGILPAIVLAVAGIAAGVGLMFEGGSLAAEHDELIERIATSKLGSIDLDVGTGVELLGGFSAVVLGILSIFGLAEQVLMPAASIVVGSALILGSSTTARMNALRVVAAKEQESTGLHIAREAVNTSAGTQVFVGIGAVVLGILGLISIASATLALIAFLAIGASLMMSGTSIGSHLFGAMKH